MRSSLTIGCLLAMIGSSIADERIDLGITPQPQRVESRAGVFRLTSETVVAFDEASDPSVRDAYAEFADSLEERAGVRPKLAADPEQAGKTILVGNPEKVPAVARRIREFGLNLEDSKRDEGYVLGIDPDGVVIGASTPAGLFYGMMTLRQLSLRHRPSLELPAVAIHDWPEFEMRGVHDEISYGQVSTMENFREILRFVAHHKMNTYFLYIEDVFRFEKYPSIGVDRGAISKEQVDEIEAFARKLHIEVIPIFEMLGNQGALLMLDEVRPFAEFPGAHSFAMSEGAFEFLENCFQELTDAFDSKYFHAGLDESWDLGFGKTEALVEEMGRGPAHAKHYRRLRDLLATRGKTMMMYADIILNRPEILDLIPKDIVLMDWQYHAAHHYPSVPKLAKAGFPLVVLSGVSCWDRIFPEMSKSLINVRNYSLDAYEHDALGSVISTWGDNGSKNFRELNYYPYAYSGEVTWSPATTDVAEFSDAYFSLRYGEGTAPAFRAIYAQLEKWPWWYPMLDYFRHPFLPRKGHRPHSEQEMFRVYEDARTALALADQVRPTMEQRQGDLDYPKFCARMHIQYVRGQRLVRELGMVSDPGAVSKARKAEWLAELDWLREETQALQDLFEDLWIRTNLPANLHYAQAEFERMVAVWEEAKNRVLANTFVWDPRPDAHWIYHPDASDATPVPTAYFRKDVRLPENAGEAGTQAFIQVHGDTHVKIYLNGEYLGEQFARRNLSAPVNPKLVELYDVSDRLRPGTNVIAIEARSYGTENENLEPGGPARSGGFHAYAEASGSTEQGIASRGWGGWVGSDETWRVSATAQDGWKEIDFDDSEWEHAEPDPRPSVWVTKPIGRHKGFSNVR